jgi:hypothetical protein
VLTDSEAGVDGVTILDSRGQQFRAVGWSKFLNLFDEGGFCRVI